MTSRRAASRSAVQKTSLWQIISPYLRVVEVGMIVLGLPLAFLGLRVANQQLAIAKDDIRIAQSQIQQVRGEASAQLLLQFDDRLKESTNRKIFSAIENGRPILKKNGGLFSTDELDDYLGVYELLDSVHEQRLITDEMLYQGLSYYLTETYENKEVKNYLQEIRKQDAEFFVGFEELAQYIASPVE